MPESQAVVTLHPLFRPDVLPFRSLTLASDSDSINIGRSSKRESNNLAPAHHNAWFESRVMSRNHAKLTVSLEEKNVYICDNDSMHGTWVNDKRITPHRDVPITTGDVLIFGTEVIHGAERIPPLKVRCECQWFDTQEEKENSGSPAPQAPNSFCVPEDDDDVIEVVNDPAHAQYTTTTTNNVDDSDIASDSENHQVAEESTPLTSPSTNGKDSAEAKSEDEPKKDQNSRHTSEALNGSEQSPIVLDREKSAVTVRIDLSGSLDSDDSGNEDDTNSHYAHDERENGSDSEGDSMSPELDCCDRDEQLAGCDYDSASDESDEDIHSKGLGGMSPSANYRPPYVEVDDDVDNASVLSCASDIGSAPESKLERDLERILDSPTDDKDDLRRLEKAKSILGSQCHDILAGRPMPDTSFGDTAAPEKFGILTDHPDKLQIGDAHEVDSLIMPKCSVPLVPGAVPSERLGDLAVSHHPHSLPPARRPSFFQSYPAMDGNRCTLPVYPGWEKPYMSYHDGPFMISDPSMYNGSCAAGEHAHAARLGFHPTGNLLDGPWYQPAEPTATPGQLELSSSSVSGSSEPQHDSGHVKANQGSPADERMLVKKKRVSISDIVHAPSVEDKSEQKESLKRKADEMEMESLSDPVAATKSSAEHADLSTIDYSAVNASEGSFSQDAQPRASEGGTKSSPSQLSDLQPIEEHQPGQSAPQSIHEDQPPRKRVNTGQSPRVGSIASHATTALVGAVVGGLGTIVALASLPPEYFQ